MEQVTVSHKRWSDEELLEERKALLATWPIGQEIDLDEAIAYQKTLPKRMVYNDMLREAKKQGEILIEVGLGHTTIEETGEHLNAVRDAGADVVMIHTDTYTRKTRYQDAQNVLEEAKRTKRSMLNGYPIACYPLKDTREMIRESGIAIEGYNADEEPMLTWEIELAAGSTSLFNHDLQELILHSKYYPLDQRIRNSQYMARLAAYYSDRGAPINVHSQALMHGYCPPSLNAALGILNLLLTAGQGVKYTGLCLSLQGHLIQDVASLRACREIGQEYLQRMGYGDREFTLSNWGFMGDWPRDVSRASGFAAMFATAAALAPVDLMYCKSVEEAVGVTKFKGNVTVIKLTKQIAKMVKNLGTFDNDEIREEKEAIKAEIRCIVDKVIEMGDGDPQVGVMRAVTAGVLDMPFSSWLLLNNKVLPVRDATGAMRYLETGNLPFTEELKKRNRQKIAMRETKENRKTGIEMLIKDLKVYSEEFARVEG